jgi:hypothetical protein
VTDSTEPPQPDRSGVEKLRDLTRAARAALGLLGVPTRQGLPGEPDYDALPAIAHYASCLAVLKARAQYLRFTRLGHGLGGYAQEFDPGAGGWAERDWAERAATVHEATCLVGGSGPRCSIVGPGSCGAPAWVHYRDYVDGLWEAADARLSEALGHLGAEVVVRYQTCRYGIELALMLARED